MLINGKLMDESTHTKYIKLINSKRNKAFGEKEEWIVKESKQQVLLPDFQNFECNKAGNLSEKLKTKTQNL